MLSVRRWCLLVLLALTASITTGCEPQIVGPLIDPALGGDNSLDFRAMELHPAGDETRIVGLANATTTVQFVVAENLTTPTAEVRATPNTDGSFDLRLPGQPDDTYRLTPLTRGVAGVAIEITAPPEGGAARPTSRGDGGSAGSGSGASSEADAGL